MRHFILSYSAVKWNTSFSNHKHLEVLDITNQTPSFALVFDFLSTQGLFAPYKTTLGAKMRWKNEIFWQNPPPAPPIKNDLRSFQKGHEKQEQKWRFCFCSWFLVPIGKWRPIFENLQNSKMEVHIWQTKTSSKKPFWFLFLISSCQKADQNWVTEVVPKGKRKIKNQKWCFCF